MAANSESQFQLLSQWAHTDQVDFWEPLARIENSVRVMVAPGKQSEWLRFLERNRIQHKLVIADVER